MNSVFQSSNYTPGGAPCNPQDTSAGLSDEMGISHSFTLTAISGVQTSFNMEYLPEAFAQSLLVYCSTQVMVLLEVFDEFAGAGVKDFVLQNHEMFLYHGCLCVIQESFQREGL